LINRYIILMHTIGATVKSPAITSQYLYLVAIVIDKHLVNLIKMTMEFVFFVLFVFFAQTINCLGHHYVVRRLRYLGQVIKQTCYINTDNERTCQITCYYVTVIMHSYHGNC